MYSNASLKRAFWIRMDPIAATWSSMGTISKRSRPCCPNIEGKVDCIYIDPPYNTGNVDELKDVDLMSEGMSDTVSSSRWRR